MRTPKYGPNWNGLIKWGESLGWRKQNINKGLEVQVEERGGKERGKKVERKEEEEERKRGKGEGRLPRPGLSKLWEGAP